MKLLGLLLLAFGVGTIVLYFTHTDVELLHWIDNWGEAVAWAIRGGAALLGLLLLMSGGKGKGKAKKA